LQLQKLSRWQRHYHHHGVVGGGMGRGKGEGGGGARRESGVTCLALCGSQCIAPQQ